MIKVYLDASVIIPALLSSSGGSFKIVQFIKLGVFVGITSQTVIEEVENNSGKIHRSSKEIRQFIYDNKILVREKIALAETVAYKGVVEEKDVHVYAGAKLTKCDYLVTLDKKLAKPLKIVRPQELLASILS